MAEDLKKKQEEQLQDEQLDKVNGGDVITSQYKYKDRKPQGVV